MKIPRPRAPQSPLLRLVLVLGFAGGVAALLYFRGPDWGGVGGAFTFVRWEWVACAVGFNLLSVVVRAMAWRTVIVQALPPPYPSHGLVFSAFSVGLFANAVLPGRVGELARVAVLVRRLPKATGLWATLVGTVFAHRVFDVVPTVFLIIFVLLTARLPDWAKTSLPAAVGLGILLLIAAVVLARREAEGASGSRIRELVARARLGLSVMRAPLAAATAVIFQCLGWLCQYFAVYTAMLAFNLNLPIESAGVVLVLMNVATILPLWPGNVGLVQAAIALPLEAYYGTPYKNGFAFGVGLQAIEASVGVGIGLIFLAREGISFAILRGLHTEPQDEEEPAGERARVPG
jgi:uncharacterized membrane protein YbhN (UPF0104 family)